MHRILMVCLGGALGTVARYALNGLISHHQAKGTALPAIFPLGTLIINVSGSFAIGFIAAISEPDLGRGWIRPELRDFLMIGLCGGYTTFSSYSLQSLNLARDGEWLLLALQVVGSNFLCLVAVYLGRVCALLLQSRFHGGAL
jgi:CrcB protein